jgi:hypothetical protein
MGIAQAQNIPGKLNNSHLHTEANTKKGSPCSRAYMHGSNFSFYSAGAKTRSYEKPIEVLQLFTNIIAVINSL